MEQLTHWAAQLDSNGEKNEFKLKKPSKSDSPADKLAALKAKNERQLDNVSNARVDA